MHIPPWYWFRPGISRDEERNRKRRALWNSLAAAKMTRSRLDIHPRDQVAALGLEMRIELALITCFNESLPDPGENWDGRRRYREMELRLNRLQWVEREQAKEYTGVKGAWNWLWGRGRPTGKELFEKMLRDSGDMIMAMADGREVDILQEVIRYSGMSPEDV